MTSHVADGLSGTGMVGSGSKYALVPGGSTNFSVKNGQGRCAKIIVTSGTGAVTLLDTTNILVTTAAATTVTVVYI